MPSPEHSRPARKKTILLVLASGIGNSILAGPLYKNLLDRGYQMDILSRQPSLAAPFCAWPGRGGILDMAKGPLGIARQILKLRRQRYDFSLVPYPSNKWQFNLLCFVLGAKSRVIHSYPRFRLRNLEFLSNKKVAARKNLHDIEQNLNLLSAFGVDRPGRFELDFPLDKKSRELADDWLSGNNARGKALVGLHIGAGTTANNGQGRQKRWPLENFSRLALAITKKYACRIVVFAGPREKEAVKRFKRMSASPDILYFENSLSACAALISRCRLFVSNDSGLMHIAAARKVPVIGIFGPTDEKRTAPFGKNCFSALSENTACRPCLEYPFSSMSARIKCPNHYKCLAGVSPRDIIGIIGKHSLLI